MRKVIIIAGLIVLVVVLTGVIAGGASGYSGGYPGKSMTGCGSCHGKAEGTKLADGSSVPYQLTVSGARETTMGKKETYTVNLTALPAGVTGGIDAAIVNATGAPDAGLAAGMNTKKIGKDIVHASPVANPPGPVNGRYWSFDWTPSAPGTYTLYVTALASNGNGSADFNNIPDGARDAWYRYKNADGQLGFTIVVK